VTLGIPPQVFFGYPHRPALRRTTIREAADTLSQQGELSSLTWEELSVGGRLIISEILQAIDQSVLAVFDITELNENVLFEVGYAVGSGRLLWLIRDKSFSANARQWDKFALLKPIGHSQYNNSNDILQKFAAERPQNRDDSVLDQLIDKDALGVTSNSLLYLASPHETNAERAILRALERERSSTFNLATADPRESAVQPLAWYVEAIAASRGVVAHFTSPNRKEADVHNARLALVSGIARGLKKPLLMLAEEDYSAPIDYQNSLFVYQVPRDAVARLNGWLQESHSMLVAAVGERPSDSLKRAIRLRSLRLGRHVAEDEAEALGDYFVETRTYIDVLDGGVRLFVGRKGAGKTAVLFRAAAELSADPRNVVCIIKPPGYELESLLRLLRRYGEKDTKGYVIESVWKFLLFSELAKATAEHIRKHRLVVTPGSPEWDLLEAVDRQGALLSGDFSVRLERAIEDLLPIDVGTGVATGRLAVSEALHDSTIRELRELLGRALSGRHRVAILVDNLDKAWERDADLLELSQFLLGLLAAMRPVAAELQKRDGGRQPIRTSLAVFLRSDIYGHVSRNAREPDKLSVSRLSWSDRSQLIRVLEERYAVAQGVDGPEIWTKLFCAEIDGRTTSDWILSCVLPRPRDLLYLANAAITTAVNRRHTSVEASDLREARQQYSTYAVESVLVEAEQDLPQIESIMYEFAGSPRVVEREEVLRRVSVGSGSKRKVSEYDALQHLLQLSFLGVETSPGVPSFVDNPQDLARATALAQNLAATSGRTVRYQVHPAFFPFFEIL
jgi:hypothetical protein